MSRGGRGGGVVEAELGVEGWVMVDGVDECGELGVCGDRLLEEGEVGRAPIRLVASAKLR